jgi:hypothetical protein
VGLNDPHAAPDAVDPHVAVQLAPAAVASLAIWTWKTAVSVADKEVTGAVSNAIEIGVATIANVTLLVADGSPVTAAVIVTVFPRGIFEGAV